MTGTALPTDFLPAERASAEELGRQAAVLAAAPAVFTVFDSMLNFCMVLSRQRQAVYVNRSFREFLKEHGIENPAGLRPGNLLGCMHAAETAGGCGTTNACRHCGAALALGAALRDEEAVRECRILSKKSGDELDLRVSAQPFRYEGEEFLLVSLIDLSAEKRREVLEKLFSHDLLSAAVGVQGLLTLVEEAGAAEVKAYGAAAAKACGCMLEQMFTQKDLEAAERGDLVLKVSEVSSGRLLNEIAASFREEEAAREKEIAVAEDSQEATICTDRTLLYRAVGHLVRNALEAEGAGSKITLSCAKTQRGAVFTVHNPGRIPEETRLQLFQRSFSTKGPGRGLGTYSVRLVTEKYLKGRVSFTTGPAGTDFRAEYPSDI